MLSKSHLLIAINCISVLKIDRMSFTAIQILISFLTKRPLYACDRKWSSEVAASSLLLPMKQTIPTTRTPGMWPRRSAKWCSILRRRIHQNSMWSRALPSSTCRTDASTISLVLPVLFPFAPPLIMGPSNGVVWMRQSESLRTSTSASKLKVWLFSLTTGFRQDSAQRSERSRRR